MLPNVTYLLGNISPRVTFELDRICQLDFLYLPIFHGRSELVIFFTHIGAIQKLIRWCFCRSFFTADYYSILVIYLIHVFTSPNERYCELYDLYLMLRPETESLAGYIYILYYIGIYYIYI